MAHHGLDGQEIYNKQLEEALKRFGSNDSQPGWEQLGPTGQFPEGKLNDDDQGEIKIAIGSENGKVVMHFGKTIGWIGFTAAQAREIAETLVQHAAAIEA